MISRCPQPAQRSELGRIANGTALVFTATFFGLGLTYVYNIFLARYFGVGVYGLYALGLAVFNLLSFIAVAGLDNATLRFVPACVASGDEMNTRRTVRTLLRLSLIFGSLLGGGLLLGSGILAVEVFQKPEMERVLRILALGIPAYAASSVLISTLQAFQKVRWRTFVKYVSEPAAKVLLTVILLWAGWNLDAALAAFVAALALSAVLTWAPLRRMFNPCKTPAVRAASATEILVFSAPLLGAILAESLATKTDVLLLGYWQSAVDVGIYSAAFQTSAIIVLVLQSFESIANPLFSESIARGDRTRLHKLYKILLRWVLTFSLPVFLVIALFPRDILALFGKNFEDGALCLVILAAGQILNAGTGSANSVLLMSGYSRLVMWNSLFIGILQIALNLMLIPRYGILGAAVAASGSLVLVNVLRIIEGRLLLGMQPYAWIVWKPLAAGAATSAVIWLLLKWLPFQNLFLAGGTVVLLYFAVLFVLGMDDDDVAAIQGVKRRFQRMAGAME